MFVLTSSLFSKSLQLACNVVTKQKMGKGLFSSYSSWFNRATEVAAILSLETCFIWNNISNSTIIKKDTKLSILTLTLILFINFHLWYVFLHKKQYKLENGIVM